MHDGPCLRVFSFSVNHSQDRLISTLSAETFFTDIHKSGQLVSLWSVCLLIVARQLLIEILLCEQAKRERGPESRDSNEGGAVKRQKLPEEEDGANAEQNNGMTAVPMQQLPQPIPVLSQMQVILLHQYWTSLPSA